jgi:hypothetical protein
MVSELSLAREKEGFDGLPQKPQYEKDGYNIDCSGNNLAPWHFRVS